MAVMIVFGMEALASASQDTFYEAHCSEPLPVFTLGENSHPTKAQEKTLCACIWENLGKWERETAAKFKEGRDSDIPWIYKQGFPSRFKNALEKCGGVKL